MRAVAHPHLPPPPGGMVAGAREFFRATVARLSSLPGAGLMIYCISGEEDVGNLIPHGIIESGRDDVRNVKLESGRDDVRGENENDIVVRVLYKGIS